MTTDDHQEPEDNTEEDQKVMDDLLDNIKNLFELGTKSNKRGFLKFARRANASLKFINNGNQAFEGIMKLAAAFKKRRARSGMNIKVQPPAIQRRKATSKTNTRLPAGRPLNALKPNKPKRKHKLADSIRNGVRHVKKH